MTISSTTRVAGPFVGNGSASTFPFAFKVFAAGDLYVATLDLATGAIATLALTSDYTVALNADQDTSPGGSITLVATGQAGANLAAGYTLIVTSTMAQLQNLDLTNGGAFYPDTINAALDTLTILVQQLAVQLARALQAPLVDGTPLTTLPAAAERAGMLLGFDSGGNVTVVAMGSGGGAGGGGSVPAAQTAAGTADGTNKNFTFTAAAGATPAVLVYAAGIYQSGTGSSPDYGISFVSGTTWQLAFTTAPAQGPITVVVFA
ncbi:MAG TPA: hypothetical protein VGR47_06030 [Terracidiphilus sp.]|nr:hypothetical protein [Terracidiphilus sp.]